MRFHPLRSDPDIAKGLGVWAHVLAIGAAMILTVLLGMGFLVLAYFAQFVAAEVAGVLGAIGFVVGFSVMFSWVGHILGAPVLHLALRRGFAGWAVALGGGLGIGLLLSMTIGGILPAVLGPLLAVLHLVALRWSAFETRRRAVRTGGNAA